MKTSWKRYRLLLPDRSSPPMPIFRSLEAESHNAARDAALQADKVIRLRIGVAICALFVFVVAIVFGLRGSETEPARPAVIANGPAYRSPAKPAPAKPLANQQQATPPVEKSVAAPASEINSAASDSREFREDGRVYSVAIVDAADLSVGMTVLAQGRVFSFDYASGMRSRPFAIVEDDQLPGKRLLCAMVADEGAEVMSLYHVRELVRVSGEYMGTLSVENNAIMPVLSDCRVAGPQDNVVRP